MTVGPRGHITASSPVPEPPLPVSRDQRRWIEAAEAEISRDRLRDLVVRMVETPSPTGSERKLAELLVAEMRSAGLEGRLQQIDALQANAIGRVAGRGDGPRVLLYSPIDTHTDGDPVRDLPWAGPELRPDMMPTGTAVDDHVIGLGANNPKGHAACLMAAAEAIVAARVPLRGDLLVGLGAGGMPTLPSPGDPLQREVVGHGHGCQRLLDDVEGIDFAVIAKPGAPLWEEVGLAIVRVSVHGSLDYAGVRHLGQHRNPILAVAKVIDGLERWFPEYTRRNSSGTVAPQGSIGAVRGGWTEKPTFVPARCDLFVDLRVSPRTSVEDAVAQLAAALDGIRTTVPEVDLDWAVLASEPGGFTDPTNWIVTSCVRAWQEVEAETYAPPSRKSGATDAAVLRRSGLPTVRVGMPRVTAGLPLPDDFSRGMNAVSLDAMERLTRTLIRCVVDTSTRSRVDVA